MTLRGAFIGRHPDAHGKDLLGRTAILQRRPEGRVVAQFDDFSTGLGFGWHEFNEKDFSIFDDGVKDPAET